MKRKRKVFVSGCYDILHAGHVQFFEDARALGDHLTVCFARRDVLRLVKNRKPCLPDEHKKILLESLRCVDKVVSSCELHPVLDFLGHLERDRPEILAVTEDDKNIALKKKVCDERGIRLVVLPKRHSAAALSTTAILSGIRNRNEVPLRVDFAGGWLDVPRLSREGAYIVNCTIRPKVSLARWPYKKGAGLGGSAAHAILEMRDGLKSELALGVGWQDPAVISETGLCVWRSGKRPELDVKQNPDWLNGRLLILWTGSAHVTPECVEIVRDYDLIEKAGQAARSAILRKDVDALGRALMMSYQVQRGENMQPLPQVAGAVGHKYLGGGHGGYALYLFGSHKGRDKAAAGHKGTKIVEPYINPPIL